MYECPNCAANLRFSIEKQKLWCEACGTELSPYEVVKDRDAEEREVFEVTVFTCPQCGAEIVSEDTEAAAFCSFCGGSTILDSRISEARRPAHIIPFTRTKADCAASYKKLVKKSLFMPSELMSTKNIDSFRGIYIPYWMYETELEGHVCADVASRHSTYKGNYEYVKHYNYETDVKTNYKGMTFDASGAFSDNLSNAIAPFDTTQLQPFTPSYLSGFYADTMDVNWDTYSEDVTDLVAEDCTERLMNDPALRDYKVDADKMKPQLTPSVGKKVLTMMPVWFMSIRHKYPGKEDRISYVAVNGQTGEAAGDLPISFGKYFIGSLILAAAIFALMFFTVSLNRVSSTVMSCVLLITMAITYYAQENKIRKWESGEDDKGQKAAHILTPAKNFDPMTGKRIRQKLSASGFDKFKIVCGILMTVLLVWVMPIYDWMFYAASILQMAFIFHFIYKLMRRYNLLTTRRLPQFNRTGGDDSAKEAHKAELD